MAILRRSRVLLADDHQEMLESIARLLTPEFEIVGQVKNGRDLIKLATDIRPDVCVIDISMPIMCGIDAVNSLNASGVRTKFVFLTVHEDQDFVQAALKSGALGYVVKSRIAEDLCHAIRTALTGVSFVSPFKNSLGGGPMGD